MFDAVGDSRLLRVFGSDLDLDLVLDGRSYDLLEVLAFREIMAGLAIGRYLVVFRTQDLKVGERLISFDYEVRSRIVPMSGLGYWFFLYLDFYRAFLGAVISA